MAEVTAGYSNMSDEDPTRMCDPCKFRGINTHAGTFCKVCSEYLCDACEEVHRSLSVTRDHELKPFDMSKWMSIKQNALITSVMKCTYHETEHITMFCLSHDAVICDRCNRTKHRRCEVKTLKDIAQDARTQNDIALYLEKTRSLVSDIKELKVSRENDKSQIEISCRKSIQEVNELKLDVIKWIEKLAKNMEDSISDIEKKLMTDAENDIELSNELSEEIQEIINSFECLENANADATFVLMTKEKHKIDEGKEATADLMKGIQPSKLEFHKSDQLVTLMSEITSIGEFKIDDPISSDDSRFCFQQIASVSGRDIDFGSTRGVSGCAFMPDGRLVVCEGNWGSQLVKVFSQDFKMESEMKIDKVWDVAVVSENQVIVTQCYEKCLQFLNISGAIAKEKTISVGEDCYGVDYNNDRIYVTCHDKIRWGIMVKILTMTGDTVNTFNVSRGCPYSIAVNSTGDRIAVSSNNDMICYDSTGTTLYTYSDSQLKDSRGLLFDAYENVMVCGKYSNNLHVVNSDGTKHTIILTSKDGLDNPYCLSYRTSDKAIFMGQYTTSKAPMLFMAE